MMDSGTSLIANLGSIPDPVTRRLVGALLLVQIEQAALSRSDLPESARRPWMCLVDEWPVLSATSGETLGEILSQTRKYGLRLHLAAQSLAQVDSDRLSGALENCRMSTTFRLGHASARVRAAQLVASEPPPPAPYRAPHSRPPSTAEQVATWTSALTQLPPRRAILQLGEGRARAITTLYVADDPGTAARVHEAADLYRGYFARRYRARAEPATMPPTTEPALDILGQHETDNITDFAAFFGEDVETIHLLPG